MLPRFSVDGVPYGSDRDAMRARKFCPSCSHASFVPGLPNRTCSQFRMVQFLAAQQGSVTLLILGVLRWSGPIQVFRRVVEGVSVFMSGVVRWARGFPVKRLAHKSVDLCWSVAGRSRQVACIRLHYRNYVVALRHSLFHQSRKAASSFSFGRAPDVSMRAGLIFRE